MVRYLPKHTLKRGDHCHSLIATVCLRELRNTTRDSVTFTLRNTHDKPHPSITERPVLYAGLSAVSVSQSVSQSASQPASQPVSQLISQSDR